MDLALIVTWAEPHTPRTHTIFIISMNFPTICGDSALKSARLTDSQSAVRDDVSSGL